MRERERWQTDERIQYGTYIVIVLIHYRLLLLLQVKYDTGTLSVYNVGVCVCVYGGGMTDKGTIMSTAAQHYPMVRVF